MNPADPQRRLLKFLVASALFFFIGTVHGVIQVIPPVRAWLDSIGSPYGGPGHMIDPLAHAHINVVGGLVMLGMAVTYYLLPVISGKPLWSKRLVDYSFWGVTIGVSAFYVLLIIFGIVEGNLMLQDPNRVSEVHRYYAPVISVPSTVMGIGFWTFFVNVFMTAKGIYKQQ